MKVFQALLSLAVAMALAGCDDAQTPFPINGPAASTPPADASIGTSPKSPVYTPANPAVITSFGIPQPAIALPANDPATGDPWPAGYIPQIVVENGAPIETQPATADAATADAQSATTPQDTGEPQTATDTSQIPYYYPGPEPQTIYVPVPHVEYAPPIFYPQDFYYPYPIFGGVIIVNHFPHHGDHDGHGGRGDDHGGIGRGGPGHSPGPVILPIPKPKPSGGPRQLTPNPPTPIIGKPPTNTGTLSQSLGNPPPGIPNTPPVAGVHPLTGNTNSVGAGQHSTSTPLIVPPSKIASAVAIPTPPPAPVPHLNPPQVRSAPPPEIVRDAPRPPTFTPEVRIAPPPPERMQSPSPPPTPIVVQQSGGRSGLDGGSPQFRGGLRAGQ